MSKQRSLLLFENSIKSEATREKYLYYLSKFKDFYKLRDYDSILQIPTEKLQEMVEDYVMDLKKRVNPNTVPTPIETQSSRLRRHALIPLAQVCRRPIFRHSGSMDSAVEGA